MRLLGSANLNISYSGKKAFNLNELKLLKLPVPDGFIVPLLENVRSKESDIAQLIDQIGGFPVAVRSSGALEDLSGASFAGMYESYLHLESIHDVLEKLELCFASVGSERVKKYAEEKKIKLNEQFSCLVQKMVKADYAGVTFTMNPINGKEEEMLIELIPGTAELLVGGEITPNQYVYNTIKKEMKLIHEEKNIPSLSEHFFSQMFKYSQIIKRHFGSPQDIEWAVDQFGQIQILQARPITTIQYRTDFPQMTNADLKDGGISARVCTPMMYSLYEKCFEQSMSEYFEKIKLKKKKDHIKWMHSFYGRGYWSAFEVKKLLFNIPGFSEKTFDEDLGIRKDYGREGPILVPTNLKTVLKILPTAYALNREYQNCQNMLVHFKAKFESQDEYYRKQIDALKSQNNSDLFNLFNKMILEYYVPTETSYYRTIYNNSNFQSDFKSFVRKLNQDIDLIKLFSGIKAIPHMQVQSDLLKLSNVARQFSFDSSEFNLELKIFLKSHYHHGDAELELKTPRWGEVPERVKELTAFMLNSKDTPLDPLATADRLGEEFQIYVLDLNQKLPIYKRNKFNQMLERARFFLSYREGMREYSTRSYYVIRMFLLEIAKRVCAMKWIDREDQIFLYNIEELLMSLKNNQSMLRPEEILKRECDYEGFRNFNAPDDFGYDSSLVQKTLDGGIIGIPCSRGVARGIARVIKDIKDINRIEAGDILITKFTDPSWTPVFSLVKGVVTEVGGILSHAAVISREYGIPAILNVKDVQLLIPDGSLIEINGETGRIDIIKNSTEI